MAEMRQYVFSYQTMLTTDVPVLKHYLLSRCLPAENAFQHVLRLEILHEGFDSVSIGGDSFGTRLITAGALAPHRTLMWQSCGRVQQTRYEIPCLKEDPYIYTLPTAHTQADEAMRAAVCDLKGAPLTADLALRLNSRVHGMLAYEKGATAIATTAAEVFKLRRGVCQDFAHLMIALARSLGFAARYAAGLIAGDGETHAWVELLLDGIWRGFDPTHDKLIDFGYVKLSHGRDALDCQVCRGVFTGNAVQQTAVHVLVGEA